MDSKNKRIILFFLILIIILIIFLTLAHGKYIKPIKRHIRIKNGHILAYAVLSPFFSWFLELYTKWSKIFKIPFTIIILSIFGGILEILQFYCTQTRKGNIKDLLFNLKGIVIGLVIFYSINFLFKKIVIFKDSGGNKTNFW